VTVTFDPDHVLVVVELGLAHGGDYERARHYVDAAEIAGADVIKWQVHVPQAESTREEAWRVDPGTGESRFDYWRRTGFSEAQWRALTVHAHGRGLAVGASTFSLEGVGLCRRIGVDLWKVASGEVTHAPVVQAMAATRRPVVISAGMATQAELRAAIGWVRKAGAPVACCECASRYPNTLRDVSLDALRRAEDWGAVPGWSDHTGAIWGSLAAVAHGAQVVEVHLALDGAEGPDVTSSLSPAWLDLLVAGIREIETLRGSRTTPDARAQGLGAMRALFLRSQRADGTWRKRGEIG